MRKAGVLLPIFALPGSLGIGDFGQSAFEWIDLMEESGTLLWQILPLNPVGYGDSPYQTYSAFAGDEIYISIEKLYETLNLDYQIKPQETHIVDYQKVRKVKDQYLQKAYKSFKKNADYQAFLKRAFWLDEYVEFITLKKQNKLLPWLDWDNFRPNKAAMDYERFVQYVFDQQWREIKNYANRKQIQIIGDLPIYLGHDSAEVYFYPELFMLNENGTMKYVAGVPADYFSKDGQLWGNPLYDWIAVAADNYQLWVNRLTWNQRLFDIIRLDHFRAFDTFWVVDGQAKTAKVGEWRLGPSYAFFNKMYDQIENLNLVVEDLGELRPEVYDLKDAYNLMGMQIVQFSLNNEGIKSNEKLDSNLIVYTGTHDNPPIQAFVDNLSKQRKAQLLKILPTFSDSLYETLVYYCLSLNAKWAIIPIQDLLGYGIETRWNVPGTIGAPNWQWKLSSFKQIKQKLPLFKEMIIKTQRYHKIK